MRRPACTILGGPNGSGKSSVYELLHPAGVFVNPDVIARQIDPRHPEAASLAAGRLALRELDRLVDARSDFVFETTLSGRHPLELMRRARLAGFEIGLFFLVLQSVDLHVQRVALRVARGGHNIPEAVIRRRYENALTMLVKALRLADETVVMDNTYRHPVVLLRIAEGSIVESRLDPEEALHTRIAAAYGQAFDRDQGLAYGRRAST